jgi:hypothetical protein
VLENSRFIDHRQDEIGFTYTDKEWEGIRWLLSNVIGWNTDVETVPSNTIDARTRKRIPGPLRLVLENSARAQQNYTRISSEMTAANVGKCLKSINAARAQCEVALRSLPLPWLLDVSDGLANNVIPELVRMASRLEPLCYHAKGNRSAANKTDDYLRDLAKIWERIDANPTLKRTWQRRFMELAATPFLGSGAAAKVATWLRAKR